MLESGLGKGKDVDVESTVAGLELPTQAGNHIGFIEEEEEAAALMPLT